MTIRPLAQDTLASDGLEHTAYDSVWTTTGVPEQQPTGLETVMLAEDKLYVVLAVVLLIWFGIAFFLVRTDRRLARLERRLERAEDAGISDASRTQL